jgi:hypothetical protein
MLERMEPWKDEAGTRRRLRSAPSGWSSSSRRSTVLGRHLSPRAKHGGERPQKEPNQAEHAERIRGENEPEDADPWDAGTSIG